MFLFNSSHKNEDGNVKTFELLKILNNIVFRGTSCSKIMCYSGWSFLGMCCTTQLKYIIPVVAKFACGGAIIVSSISISVWIISLFIYDERETEETEFVETEHEKYLNFINNDYELFIDIYKNNKEDYFMNKSETFIDELKDINNHETYELPYSYNPTLMFYYDNDTKSFQYYCQSDVPCKILNSACRTYTIIKKCIQLFRDEEEIQYMKAEAFGAVDISCSNISEEISSSNPLSKTEPEEEEESNGFINIFYNKQNNRKSQKMKIIPQLDANKFVYKGTLDDYNTDFLKRKTSFKKTSYEEYLAQCAK